MTVSVKAPTSTTGSIQLNGSDVLTIDSSGNVTVPNHLNLTGELQVNASAGTSGQVLTSQGSGSDPVWANASAGKVLQMQYTTSDTRSSYSLTGSTVYTISELDLTITPTASSSKIILNYNVFMEADNDISYRIYRNGTQIGQNSASTDVWSGIAAQTNDEGLNNTPHMLDIHYVDSPASTSAQTYTLRMVSTNGLSWSFYINRSKNNTGAGSTEIGRSTVYALEVAP